MNLVLLGPPGSGKGTQAGVLVSALGLTHIAMGDLLREHVALGDPLGLRVRDFMSAGVLVPDAVAIEMLRGRLQREPAGSGIVFDGFPRTVSQAQALDAAIRALGRLLHGAVQIDVPDEDLVSRLSGRLVCRECRASFHEIANPFTACPSGKCHGEFLYRRDDDKPKTVRARLEVYHRETEPLIAYYDAGGRLARVDGSGSLDEVTRGTLDAARRLQASYEKNSR